MSDRKQRDGVVRGRSCCALFHFILFLPDHTFGNDSSDTGGDEYYVRLQAAKSMNPLHLWVAALPWRPPKVLLQSSARLWIMEKGQDWFLMDLYTTWLQLHQQGLQSDYLYYRGQSMSLNCSCCCVEYTIKVSLSLNVDCTLPGLMPLICSMYVQSMTQF